MYSCHIIAQMLPDALHLWQLKSATTYNSKQQLRILSQICQHAVLYQNHKAIQITKVNHHPIQHTCKLVSGNQEAGSLAQHSSALTRHKMQQFVGHLHEHQLSPSALHQHTACQDLCLQCWYDMCTCLCKCLGLAPEICRKKCSQSDNVFVMSDC